jgi:uncharacterized protein YecE (DUF72 family)
MAGGGNASLDRAHDPGADAALARLPAAGETTVVAPIHRHRAEILLGVASWTDRTMTAPGVFYPQTVKTPEARLRYYASRFPLVEVDATYYALPAESTARLWVDRTPAGFTFDVKAHALMTGHATETARLPRALRDSLPAEVRDKARVYAKELPREFRDEIWRAFREGIEPLRASGKLGAVMMQFPPWVRPAAHTPEMLERVRQRLGDLPVTVEFRHPSWLAPRMRERVWDLLRRLDMTYVVADTPPDTPASLPIVPAITTPRLAVVRLHGRRSELWGATDAPVVEKYRYLYDSGELGEWKTIIDELAEQAERIHVVFNNCYANYGTTNAAQMASLLREI